MGSLSDWGELKWLEHIFDTAYTAVATIYLGLCTADPTDAGTGASCSEVAHANGYERTAIAFGTASARKITQNAICTFPQASGAWGTVTHYVLLDNATYGSGNVLAHGAFTSSFAPVAGNTPSVASGQVYVEISASSGEGWTTQLCNWMLDKIFRNQTYAQPATYVALLDSQGADADTTLTTAGKEVAGTDYARVLVNKTGGASPAWSDPATPGGTVDNANDITFPTVGSGGWSTVVGMALVDSGTLDTGNVLAFDNDQVVDQTPAAGDTVKFVAAALDASMS